MNSNLRLFLVVVTMTLPACGGSPTNSPGFAQFVEGGPLGGGPTLTVGICAIGRTCEFTRRIRNDGNACAKGVRGVLTYTDRGQQVASFEWALSPDHVVRPAESVEVKFSEIPYDVTVGTVSRLTATAWEVTECR